LWLPTGPAFNDKQRSDRGSAHHPGIDCSLILSADGARMAPIAASQRIVRDVDFLLDAWHGSGVASILMAALMDAARERGFMTMEGTVLATNRRMLKFVRRLGFAVLFDAGDLGTVRVVLPLRR